LTITDDMNLADCGLGCWYCWCWPMMSMLLIVSDDINVVDYD